ncbi:hypothetical protein ACIQTZ_14085 [Paenarthrobacter sp. NPDC090520]|uniref:hypothetical protein n=1 Tax=Paenarthrobacter sp. NPDC090520 TaxID=3364382 RepID=UPI0038127223
MDLLSLGAEVMHGKWKIAVTVVAVAGVSVAAVAATSPSENAVEKALDIVPAMGVQQQVSDRLPEAASKTFSPTGIDLASVRLVGKTTNAQYFAAAMGTDQICIVTAGHDGSGQMMGCTFVKGFEGYGLRVANPDKSEEAWLVVPGSTQAAAASDPGKWDATASNFLVNETSR